MARTELKLNRNNTESNGNQNRVEKCHGAANPPIEGHWKQVTTLFLRRWLQLRFDFDWTAMRPTFDFDSTAIRPRRTPLRELTALPQNP